MATKPTREQIDVAAENCARSNCEACAFIDENCQRIFASAYRAKCAEVEKIIDWLCGDADYAIVRCQKYTKEELRKIAHGNKALEGKEE